MKWRSQKSNQKYHFLLVQTWKIAHAFRHSFHWFSAPDSTPTRTWKRTHWMTLESPCAYRYHKDSWPEPAMKMQSCTLYPRQCWGQRRHLQKRVVSLPSTVLRIEGDLKNGQKCLKIQKVVSYDVHSLDFTWNPNFKQFRQFWRKVVIAC